MSTLSIIKFVWNNPSDGTQELLEIAALTHNIGIKNSEKKYHSSAGNYQQTEGPPEAKKILEGLGIKAAVIDRVCWLIVQNPNNGAAIGIPLIRILQGPADRFLF